MDKQSMHSRRLKKFHKVTFLVPIIYLIIVSALMMMQGVFFSPDLFFVLALIIALVLGRSKQFIREWSIPIILLLSYDYLRGLVPKLTQNAHIYPMINFDKAIFGDLPTNSLQSLLITDGVLHWYDYMGTFLYMSHFIVPMVVGFIFWLKDKESFKGYFLTLLLLSYAAFFTYIIFPAMPPWMAAQQGIIPAISKVMDKVFWSLPSHISLPTIYQAIGVNLVAAVPSLHAAYPWLTFLFVYRKYNFKSLLVLPYVFGVWFSIVYFGEHYIFDIVTGVLYATVFFVLVMKGDLIWQKIKLAFH